LQKSSEKRKLKNEEDKIVSLFPYQIKNRNLFYHRDHPEKLNPDTRTYERYWSEQLKYYIEGRWINDEGTWVYMMPKLFFLINYTKIYDKERRLIFPDLRDIEWIIFTYFMGMDGFSGFEDDPDFTCHYLIKKKEDGDKLSARDFLKIPPSCKKSNGDFKKYVDPWHYLTKHYLIEHPAKKPLGRALYDNPRKNGIILAARGLSKSIGTFVGDFSHEFLTGGIKSIDEIGDLNNQLNFVMGCGDSRQLDRSIANIKSFYDNMPGQFEYEEGVSMGPLFKRVQGSWKTGSSIQHVVKREDGTDKIRGSLLQMVALTPDRSKVGAGDRFRRIYLEEVGFIGNLFEVLRSNKDSMQIGGYKVGSMVMIGTGGSLKAIQEPKAVFERPEAYDVFGIPNHWKNIDKKVGLFIPAYYALLDYKDENGNSALEDAYQAIVDKRNKLRQDLDAMSYESEIMFNPLVPDEMLRPSDGSVLPKQAAATQLSNLETFDVFKIRAMIGDIVYNALESRGVEFKKDFDGSKKPILKWGATTMEAKTEGAIIIYEDPPQHVPEGLYYVIYDPVSKSGDGTSYNSVLVYKNFYRGPEESLYDTIVAEWIGRKERLEDNYHMVIKIAKYFNAKIFPEVNVAGFVEWCGSNNYYSLLEPDATYFLREELNPKYKSYYKVGFQMQGREKDWALKRLRDWLLEVKRHDPVTGVPTIKTIDWIFSPRILDEIIAYTDDKDYNFDHISSLLGLMILIGKLGKEPVDIIDEEEPLIKPEMQEYFETLKKHQMLLGANKRPSRSKFLSY
jgi:hypothetical protein